jgi:hypothetical protein
LIGSVSFTTSQFPNGGSFSTAWIRLRAKSIGAFTALSALTAAFLASYGNNYSDACRRVNGPPQLRNTGLLKQATIA